MGNRNDLKDWERGSGDCVGNDLKDWERGSGDCVGGRRRCYIVWAGAACGAVEGPRESSCSWVDKIK